jgi:hypothetical protein
MESFLGRKVTEDKEGNRQRGRWRFPETPGYEAALVLLNVLLMLDQSPLIVVLMPLSKPTAASAMNASRREYSTIS